MKGTVKTVKYLNGIKQVTENVEIAYEAPLTINLNGKEMVTLLSSPACWDELAVGFLLSEGLLKPKKENLEIQLDYEQGMAWISSPHIDNVVLNTWQKRFVSSGCGSGSGKNFYALSASRQPVLLDTQTIISAKVIGDIMKDMNRASQTYSATHGVHGAALAGKDKIEVFREDVGRHNALDKIRGYCFLSNISTAGKILFSTGRISSEMLLKAARLEVPVVVSRSAPTILGIEYAKALNITLVGMVRGQRLNIYTVHERII